MRRILRQSVASKPTLLRKLLAPQLHRESSIALQAVRFIVESNFFLDPAPSSAAELSPPEPSPPQEDASSSLPSGSVTPQEKAGNSVLVDGADPASA